MTETPKTPARKAARKPKTIKQQRLDIEALVVEMKHQNAIEAAKAETHRRFLRRFLTVSVVAFSGLFGLVLYNQRHIIDNQGQARTAAARSYSNGQEIARQTHTDDRFFCAVRVLLKDVPTLSTTARQQLNAVPLNCP